MPKRSRRRPSSSKRTLFLAPGPAPGHLEVLRRFLNTAEYVVGLKTVPDQLQTRRETESWLAEQKHLPEGAELARADVHRLRDLRDALKALATGSPASPAERTAARERLQEILGDTRFELDLAAPGKPRMRALGSGLDHLVASWISIFVEALYTGQWRRFKLCPFCGRAFFDKSRNHTRKWCTTRCGDRVRTRKYLRKKQRKEEVHRREQQLAASREARRQEQPG